MLVANHTRTGVNNLTILDKANGRIGQLRNRKPREGDSVIYEDSDGVARIGQFQNGQVRRDGRPVPGRRRPAVVEWED